MPVATSQISRPIRSSLNLIPTINNVQFYVPRRYCYNTIDTDGHGIMIGYDLVGSDTHIVFSKVSGITVEIDDWSASSEILTDEKMIRKGIIEGNFRRLIKSWIRLASSSRNGVAVLAGEVKP